MSVPYAAGALRSTAEDMARWNAALFGGKLLKPESLKEMLAPGRLRNGAENQTAIAWPGGKAFAPPAGLRSRPLRLRPRPSLGEWPADHRPRRLDRRVRCGNADLRRRGPDDHRPDEHERRRTSARGKGRENSGAIAARLRRAR